MKKFYFLAVALVVLAANWADARPQFKRVPFRVSHPSAVEVQSKASVSKQRRAAAPAGKWVAKTMVESMPDDMGNWFEVSRYSSTYTPQALPLCDVMEDLSGDMDTKFMVTDFEYNADGKNTLQLVSAGDDLQALEAVSKWERSYDSRVPQLVTASAHYDFFDGEWMVAGNAYIREVERNEAGNITDVVYKTLYMGAYEAVQKVNVTYGSDGKAESITEWQLAYDDNFQEYWKEGYSFRDCKWVQTDGQLWSLDYVFEGENKIASFTEYSEGELIGDMTVTYSADGFETFMNCEEQGFTTGQKWTDLENGGFLSVVNVALVGEEEPLMYTVEIQEFDTFGNSIKAIAFDYFVGEDQPYEIYQWENAVSSYDANGCPVSVEISTFYPAEDEDEWFAPARKKAPEFSFDVPPVEGVWENLAKFEFSDFEYITTTGVGSIEADKNAAVEYFTIDGRKVDNPSAGLYIRRQGSMVSKAVVR